MDLVIVAVPSADVPDCAEVLCFKRNVVMEAFNRALVRIRSETLPSRIRPRVREAGSIDDPPVGSSGLKAEAEWVELVPLGSVPVPGAEPPSIVDSFVQRVKHEFAQLVGVDVAKVEVKFRIVA